MSTKIQLILIVLLLISCTQTQEEIAQWKGPNRDGIYNEKNLLDEWPEEGPVMLWAIEGIGNGYGAPSVTSSTLYVSGEIDSISYLQAYDLDGKLLWKKENGKGFVGEDFSARFPGSKSAPTVIEDKVYAFSGMGRLTCFNAKSGDEIWSVDMLEDFDGRLPRFGYCESPLINEGVLYCFPGGEDNFAIALDRLTGEKIWSTANPGDTIFYATPNLVKLDNRNLIVNFAEKNLNAFDAASGEFLWSQGQEKRQRMQVGNTPVFKDGYLYYLNGDGHGAAKLAITDNGNSYEEIWSNYTGRNAYLGYVVKDDRFYYLHDKNKLLALDTETGEGVDTLNMRVGSCVYADEKLFCYSNNGDFSLVDLRGEKMELVSEFKIEKGTKEHLARPVIKNGVLYVRHGEALMAYRVQ